MCAGTITVGMHTGLLEFTKGAGSQVSNILYYYYYGIVIFLGLVLPRCGLPTSGMGVTSM